MPPTPAASRPSITWPIVALVAIVLLAFVAIFALIPESEATSRSALLAVVVGAGNGVVLLVVSRANKAQATQQEFTQTQVEGVKRLVNGHTSAILAKIPDAVEREAARVHFETLLNQDLQRGNHD